MPKAKKSSGFSAPAFPARLLPPLFLLVPVLFFTGTRDPFFIKETLAQSLLVLLTLFWIVRAASNSEFKFRNYPLLIPLACYLGAQLLSTKNAVHPAMVLQNAAWQALLIGLYVSIIDFADESVRKNIRTALLWASVAAGLYGALQRFGLDFIQWGVTWSGRPASTFGNPNFAAGWWILIIPIFAAESVKGERRWGAVLAVALAVLNLYWGRTLGAWAAILAASGIAGGVWLGERKGLLKKSVALPLLIALGAGAFGAAFLVSARRMPDHQSIQERVLKWRTAAKMISDQPLLGVGAGNVKVHFALYQADVSRAMGRSLIGTSESNVHNEFLQVAAETGFAGLAAFLSIFALWLYRRMKEDPFDLEDAGQLAAVLAFLFYSLTNFPFRITPNACLLIYLLAASEMIKTHSSDEPSSKQPDVPLSPLRYAAIALIGAAIFWKWILPPFRAERIWNRAEALKARNDFAGAADRYERVIALDFYRSERAAYELGECRRALRDIPGALEAYQISVKLRNYGEVYNNIGNCYYLLGRFSDAKSNWQKAADLKLPDPQAQSQTIENIRAIERLHPEKI